MQTRTLTLVIQHVGEDILFERLQDVFGVALREYVADAGGGLFERHITKNGCRIDAIRSVAPAVDAIASEFEVATDGTEALRARLLQIREQIEFLPTGEHADSPVASIVQYDAIGELRKQIDEAIAAIPEQSE